MRISILRVLPILLASIVAPPARADEVCPAHNERQPTVRWNSAWAKFRPLQYATTAVLIAADVAIVHLVPDPARNWDGALPLDGFGHSALRATTSPGRYRAQVVSDRMHEINFLVGLTEAPIAAAARGDWETAWQVTWINAQSYALAGLVQLGAARLVGRVRPAVRRCEETKSTEFPCNHGGPTLSFISGHAMTSFVSAGLMCAHHGRLPLWGGGLGDVSACVLMLTSATATGVLRIVADKHYTSDVMIGSILGFAIGYAMPMLMHYRRFNDVKTKAEAKTFYALGLIPYVTTDRIGTNVVALF